MQHYHTIQSHCFHEGPPYLYAFTTVTFKYVYQHSRENITTLDPCKTPKTLKALECQLKDAKQGNERKEVLI